GVAGFTLPDEGGLAPARGVDVTVETVVGDVELPAHEPLRVGHLPLERLLPRLEPAELAREAFPEPDGILGGLRVDRRPVDVRALGELLGRNELPLLPEESFDGSAAAGCFGRHRPASRMGVGSGGTRRAPAIF